VGIAPAVAKIEAGIPTRPTVDRCGCKRRNNGRHVSRESEPARSKAKSAPGKTGYELAAHWPDPPILSLIRQFVSLRCQGMACNPVTVQERKYPACVALQPHAAKEGPL
jgi:hypothetical protein